MASKGTRNTSITFGSFELAVTLSKAQQSRDVKLERFYADGTKFAAGGGAGSRRGVDVDAGESYGIRLSDTQVLRFPQEDLEAITAQSVERWGSMQVLECIDYRQVPTARITGSYWLQPAQGTAQGLYLLHAALSQRDKVAIVKWVGTSREKLGVIRPRWVTVNGGKHRALLLSELVFANDFADPDEDVLAINTAEAMMNAGDIEAHARAVEAARGLVDAFSRQPGDPKHVDEASDTAVDARLELLERLQSEALTAGLEASVKPAAAGAPPDLWEGALKTIGADRAAA